MEENPNTDSSPRFIVLLKTELRSLEEPAEVFDETAAKKYAEQYNTNVGLGESPNWEPQLYGGAERRNHAECTHAIVDTQDEWHRLNGLPPKSPEDAVFAYQEAMKNADGDPNLPATFVARNFLAKRAGTYKFEGRDYSLAYCRESWSKVLNELTSMPHYGLELEARAHEKSTFPCQSEADEHFMGV
jgi:hypothetical protein